MHISAHVRRKVRNGRSFSGYVPIPYNGTYPFILIPFVSPSPAPQLPPSFFYFFKYFKFPLPKLPLKSCAWFQTNSASVYFSTQEFTWGKEKAGRTTEKKQNKAETKNKKTAENCNDSGWGQWPTSEPRSGLWIQTKGIQVFHCIPWILNLSGFIVC